MIKHLILTILIIAIFGNTSRAEQTNIYNKIETESALKPDVLEGFQKAVRQGKVTEKEKELWNFILTAYGESEFSTKKLEKDFGKAAYATIRGFVLKFEKIGLLRSVKYGNRVKYRIRN